MTMYALSYIKIATAVSFLCILVVLSNSPVVPMFLIFLLGLGSIVTGDATGFVFSVLGMLSTGYLVLSSLVNIRKINFVLSGTSITILVALAIYGIFSSPGMLPFNFVHTYGVFFFFALLYLAGSIIRIKACRRLG